MSASRAFPLTIPGGWWLSADHGVARSAPATRSDGHTIFGLVRIDGIEPGTTLIAHGGWRIAADANETPVYRATANAPDVPFGPPAPEPGYAFFIVTKTGRLGRWWWNGVLEAKFKAGGKAVETNASPCSGDPATAPLSSCIRELGFYGHALADAEIDALIDWLSTRMPPFSLSWGGRPLTGPYDALAGAEHFVVLEPSGAEPVEHDIASHRYRHHSRVAVHKGRVWVAFSSGCVGEDASGQMVAAAYSDDDGKSWSAPLAVVPPQSAWRRPDDPEQPGYQPDTRICYPRAFVRHEGALYLVAAVDAVNGLLDLTGAALVAAACRDDGSIGPPVRVSAAPYPPKPGCAAIDYDDRLGPALFGDADRFGHWGGSTPGNAASAWTGWLAYRGVSFAEPALIPLDADGRRWLRLWRRLSRGNRVRLYASFSEDGGARFGPPFRTSIPNAPSSMAGLRLNDGRIALVGNPMDGATNRDPLYLAVFDADGMIESVRAVRQGLSGAAAFPGWNKHGAASYPGIAQDGDRLYISYSINKETIGLTRVASA